jgi:hypothetical protein
MMAATKSSFIFFFVRMQSILLWKFFEIEIANHPQQLVQGWKVATSASYSIQFLLAASRISWRGEKR